jgi:hypothetical protein
VWADFGQSSGVGSGFRLCLVPGPPVPPLNTVYRKGKDMHSHLKVFVRKISAPCAHLFSELCCSANGLWYAMIIQLNRRSQQLMASVHSGRSTTSSDSQER